MEYRYRFTIEANGHEPEAEILVGELEFETGVEAAKRACVMLAKRWGEPAVFVAYDIGYEPRQIVETMSSFGKANQ